MAHGRDTEGRMHNSFKALVETVLFVFLQMILMATLCKLRIPKPHIARGPPAQHLADHVLAGEGGGLAGMMPDCSSVAMKMKTFLLASKK